MQLPLKTLNHFNLISYKLQDLYDTAVSNEFAKAFEAHGYKPLQKVNKVIEVQ